MELKEFIEHFAEQFEDTATEIFNPDTVFKELDEWSSLQALGIISMADEYYGVILSSDDIRNSNTIKDLFNIIKNKNNG